MKKWGDRYDAYRVRDIDGMHFYMAYLMPKRTDAEVYINEKIDSDNCLFLDEFDQETRKAVIESIYTKAVEVIGTKYVNILNPVEEVDEQSHVSNHTRNETEGKCNHYKPLSPFRCFAGFFILSATFAAFWLTEIDAAGQFAHAQDVEAVSGNVCTQRTECFQPLIQFCRAQVAE